MLTITLRSRLIVFIFKNIMSSLDQKIIEKTSKRFFSGTLLSRISGMMRDVVMAYVFGASALIAALMLAFRLSSLLRRIFGEGALHAAFVPVFEKIRGVSKNQAAQFFVQMIVIIAVFLLIIILGFEFLATGGILAFKHGPMSDTFYLTLLLFPSLLFVCQAAFWGSYLQCQTTFFLPAVSPAVLNLFWICGALILRNTDPHRAVYLLSLWIMVGLLMQWLILVPKTITFLKQDLTEKVSFKWGDLMESYRKIAAPLGLGILGVSSSQINSAVDSLIARFVCPEGPAYLWYAIRIEQVPLALFGVAMAGAILPPLSRAFQKSKEEFIKLLDYSLSSAAGLLIPCSIALLLTTPACVNLFYGRGHFTIEASYNTSLCLWAYTLGLVAQGMSLIFAPAFYVQNKYKITTKASFLALIMNVILNVLLVLWIKKGSWEIALATSISSWINLLYLLHHFKREHSLMGLVQLKACLPKIIVIALFSAIISYILTVTYNPLNEMKLWLHFPRGAYLQLITLVMQSGCYLIFLFGLAKIFKVQELLKILHYVYPQKELLI